MSGRKPRGKHDEQRVLLGLAAMLAGIGLLVMAGFLLFRLVQGELPVWDRRTGTYWSRADSLQLAAALGAIGGALVWLGNRKEAD